MNKNFLLEQLNRAEFSTLDENKFFELNNKDDMWPSHNEGHIEMINLIRNWIANDTIVDANRIKKLIRKRVKYNCDVIKKIEEKNNNWENDEDDFDNFFKTDDGFLYSLSDGMNCEAGTFLRILNKKYYYSKKCYNPTDWEEFMK